MNILAFLKPKASSEALKRGAESALSALQQGIEVPELDASSAAALAKALAELANSTSDSRLDTSATLVELCMRLSSPKTTRSVQRALLEGSTGDSVATIIRSFLRTASISASSISVSDLQRLQILLSWLAAHSKFSYKPSGGSAQRVRGSSLLGPAAVPALLDALFLQADMQAAHKKTAVQAIAAEALLDFLVYRPNCRYVCSHPAFINGGGFDAVLRDCGSIVTQLDVAEALWACQEAQQKNPGDLDYALPAHPLREVLSELCDAQTSDVEVLQTLRIQLQRYNASLGTAATVCSFQAQEVVLNGRADIAAADLWVDFCPTSFTVSLSPRCIECDQAEQNRTVQDSQQTALPEQRTDAVPSMISIPYADVAGRVRSEPIRNGQETAFTFNMKHIPAELLEAGICNAESPALSIRIVLHTADAERLRDVKAIAAGLRDARIPWNDCDAEHVDLTQDKRHEKVSIVSLPCGPASTVFDQVQYHNQAAASRHRPQPSAGLTSAAPPPQLRGADDAAAQQPTAVTAAPVEGNDVAWRTVRRRNKEQVSEGHVEAVHEHPIDEREEAAPVPARRAGKPKAAKRAPPRKKPAQRRKRPPAQQDGEASLANAAAAAAAPQARGGRKRNNAGQCNDDGKLEQDHIEDASPLLGDKDGNAYGAQSMVDKRLSGARDVGADGAGGNAVNEDKDMPVWVTEQHDELLSQQKGGCNAAICFSSDDEDAMPALPPPPTEIGADEEIHLDVPKLDGSGRKTAPKKTVAPRQQNTSPRQVAQDDTPAPPRQPVSPSSAHMDDKGGFSGGRTMQVDEYAMLDEDLGAPHGKDAAAAQPKAQPAATKSKLTSKGKNPTKPASKKAERKPAATKSVKVKAAAVASTDGGAGRVPATVAAHMAHPHEQDDNVDDDDTLDELENLPLTQVPPPSSLEAYLYDEDKEVKGGNDPGVGKAPKSIKPSTMLPVVPLGPGSARKPSRLAALQATTATPAGVFKRGPAAANGTSIAGTSGLRQSKQEQQVELRVEEDENVAAAATGVHNEPAKKKRGVAGRAALEKKQRPHQRQEVQALTETPAAVPGKKRDAGSEPAKHPKKTPARKNVNATAPSCGEAAPKQPQVGKKRSAENNLDRNHQAQQRPPKAGRKAAPHVAAPRAAATRGRRKAAEEAARRCRMQAGSEDEQEWEALSQKAEQRTVAEALSPPSYEMKMMDGAAEDEDGRRVMRQHAEEQRGKKVHIQASKYRSLPLSQQPSRNDNQNDGGVDVAWDELAHAAGNAFAAAMGSKLHPPGKHDRHDHLHVDVEGDNHVDMGIFFDASGASLCSLDGDGSGPPSGQAAGALGADVDLECYEEEEEELDFFKACALRLMPDAANIGKRSTRSRHSEQKRKKTAQPARHGRRAPHLSLSHLNFKSSFLLDDADDEQDLDMEDSEDDCDGSDAATQQVIAVLHAWKQRQDRRVRQQNARKARAIQEEANSLIAAARAEADAAKEDAVKRAAETVADIEAAIAENEAQAAAAKAEFDARMAALSQRTQELKAQAQAAAADGRASVADAERKGKRRFEEVYGAVRSKVAAGQREIERAAKKARQLPPSLVAMVAPFMPR